MIAEALSDSEHERTWEDSSKIIDDMINEAESTFRSFREVEYDEENA